MQCRLYTKALFTCHSLSDRVNTVLHQKQIVPAKNKKRGKLYIYSCHYYTKFLTQLPFASSRLVPWLPKYTPKCYNSFTWPSDIYQDSEKWTRWIQKAFACIQNARIADTTQWYGKYSSAKKLRRLQLRKSGGSLIFTAVATSMIQIFWHRKIHN